jgi:hypothetical protein
VGERARLPRRRRGHLGLGRHRVQSGSERALRGDGKRPVRRSNVGPAFSESVGYGEHLVELDPSLSVVSSNHPTDLTAAEDLDFAGSPVVLDRPGCGELVVAADKDDELYGWRASDIAEGPLWSIQLEPFDGADPLLSQLAWSPTLDSVYAVTGTHVDRVSIAPSCGASVAWSKPLGTSTENGSPTIAGATLWFAVDGKPALVSYDAASGKQLSSTPVAPTVAGGRMVIPTFTGLVEGFTFDAARTLSSAVRSAAAVSAVSWSSAKDAWESKSGGVFATEDAGGRSWHLIYPQPAMSILRLSAHAGVIELGLEQGPCMCTTRKLWTADDGRSWHATVAIGASFAGAGTDVYWWEKGELHAITDFPPADPASPIDARLDIDVPDGTIVATARLPVGFAFLVSSRVDGQHWDTSPRVLLADGATVQTVRLPAAPNGEILAATITADGSTLTVQGTNFGTDPTSPVSWVSTDAGETWSLST